ncbi:hypothetical protein HJC23_009035 [Cyclotella cryptica]|uniref:Uncharacterized protein n=1 Tax=Cyclotella cryptica TaxID=29204 RepID=A0ABD3QYN7_9STRA
MLPKVLGWVVIEDIDGRILVDFAWPRRNNKKRNQDFYTLESSSNCIFQPLCIVWEIFPPEEAPPNHPVLMNLVLLHVTLSEIDVQVVASEIT